MVSDGITVGVWSKKLTNDQSLLQIDALPSIRSSLCPRAEDVSALPCAVQEFWNGYGDIKKQPNVWDKFIILFGMNTNDGDQYT